MGDDGCVALSFDSFEPVYIVARERGIGRSDWQSEWIIRPRFVPDNARRVIFETALTGRAPFALQLQALGQLPEANTRQADQ
jgi:hypothetical protein